MPLLEIADCFQKIVLWSFTGYDTYGQPTVAAPVQIVGRWIVQKSEAVDPKGNTIALDGTVIVTQDIAIGSHLWLGNLNDWYGTGSGLSQADELLYEVKTFQTTPDVKGRALRRVAGVMRLHQRGAD